MSIVQPRNSISEQLLCSIRQSFIFSSLKAFTTQLSSTELRTFTITVGFYLSLYFSSSNRSFIVLAFVFVAVLYLHLRELNLTFFLACVAVLPFVKGKSVEFLLLPKELVVQNPLFDISYFFIVYAADVFLCLLLFLYLRPKLTRNIPNSTGAHHTKHQSQHQLSAYSSLPQPLVLPLCALTAFVLVALIPSLGSPFPAVILLSSIELLKMLMLLCLPSLTMAKKQLRSVHLMLVILASTYFQSVWAVMQHLHGGNLGKDIEAYLPGFQYGILSSESSNQVLRVTGTFFEPSILATFLLMNSCILAFVLCTQPKLQHRWLYILGIIISVVALIYTGSRGLYLLTALTSLGFAYWQRQQLKQLWLKYSSYHKPILIGGVALALTLLPFLLTRLTSLSEVFSSTGSGTYRLQIATYALRLAATSPFGVGLNLSPYYFATAFPQENYIFDPAHPHSLVFQLLAETGIVGTLVFVFFLWSLYRPWLAKHQPLNGFILASLIYLCAAQFYPIFISQPEILSFFFVYAGIGVALTYYNHHDQKP